MPSSSSLQYVRAIALRFRISKPHVGNLGRVANHAHAMALHFLYYNFVRVHKTLRTTPAMAAGVTKRLWEMSDVVDILEAWEARTTR